MVSLLVNWHDRWEFSTTILVLVLQKWSCLHHWHNALRWNASYIFHIPAGYGSSCLHPRAIRGIPDSRRLRIVQLSITGCGRRPNDTFSIRPKVSNLYSVHVLKVYIDDLGTDEELSSSLKRQGKVRKYVTRTVNSRAHSTSAEVQ